MDMIQSQIVDSDGSMDAGAFYRDNMIVIKPCPWDNDKAMELTPGKRLSFVGRTVIEVDGRTTTFRYNIGSRGNRYMVLFKTKHCELLMTQGGTIIEKWRFKPEMTTADICDIRLQEGQDIITYLQHRKEVGSW